MFIAEGPGAQEDKHGIPFWYYAKAAKEFNRLLRDVGLSRDHVYITNMVKCHVPHDEDPNAEQIERCSVWLEEEIKNVRPKLIVTLGGNATKYVLGCDIPMEFVHGITYDGDYFNHPGCSILPAYHPAAGLHQSSIMGYCQDDFKLILPALRGAIKPRTGLYWDEPTPHYSLLTGTEFSAGSTATGSTAHTYDTIAIDTEWARQRPWCLTFSVEPGTAAMIKAAATQTLTTFNEWLHDSNMTVLIHNVLYDWPVLEDMGINLTGLRVVDTMVMAYLLQDLPQGLKPLAYRIAGIEMGSYSDTVASATHYHAMGHLAQVVQRSWAWEKPEPQLLWERGEPKPYQPQSIGQKVARILGDQWFRNADPHKRWYNIDAEDRELSDAILGVLQQGELCDIPFEQALWYACRDADATLRIYPFLQSRITEMGLDQTLEMDMGTIEMIVDMQKTGIVPDLERVADLSGYFAGRMKTIEAEINETSGSVINPGSHPDVRHLLYDHLGISPPKRKTSKGEHSTDAKALGQIKHSHPVVQQVLDWREIQKLKTTYADTIPKFVQADGRIHPNARITRTATGRLSFADPNLMAVPTRTEEGRKIRECYVPPPGYVIICADYCLPGKTKIITTDGLCFIEELKPGDRVLSSGDGNTLQFERVKRQAHVGTLPAVKLTFTDGTTQVCSIEHKWMTYNGELVETKNLKAGDRLAHVKTGYGGSRHYPTWWLKSHHNYSYKHQLVAEAEYGLRPDSLHVDHIDGNVTNWVFSNLRYLPASENVAQGGRRYWEEVKAQKRSDGNRLQNLRIALKYKRRSYIGAGNPNYGNRKGKPFVCANPNCGKMQYAAPSRKQKYCNLRCYQEHLDLKRRNYEIKSIHHITAQPMYQIEVTNTHTYVLANGLISGNSQIELRHLAHDAQEPMMLKVFNDGGDIHTMTAMEVFGLSESQVDNYKHRRPCKRVNFGIPYGVTAAGLQEILLAEGADAAEWSIDRCDMLIQTWLQRFSRIADYISETHAYARRNGYVRDVWGRIRRIPQAHMVDKYIRAEGLREAQNQPIQSGAQGTIKRAMKRLTPIYKQFQADGIDLNPLMQIHDDLMWYCPVDAVRTVAPVIRDTMEQASNISISTPVDVEICSHTWSKKTALNDYLGM